MAVAHNDVIRMTPTLRFARMPARGFLKIENPASSSSRLLKVDVYFAWVVNPSGERCTQVASGDTKLLPPGRRWPRYLP